MEHKMAELNERIFETMEKKLAGLVVASYVIVGSQTAIYSLSLKPKYPVVDIC